MKLKKIGTVLLVAALTFGVATSLTGCGSEEDKQRGHERAMQRDQMAHERAMQRDQMMVGGRSWDRNTTYYDAYGSPVNPNTYTGPRYDQYGGGIDGTDVAIFAAGALTGYAATKYVAKRNPTYKVVNGKNVYYGKNGSVITKAEYNKRKAQSERDRAAWVKKEQAKRASYAQSNPKSVVSKQSLKQKQAAARTKRATNAKSQAAAIKANKGVKKAPPKKLNLNKQVKKTPVKKAAPVKKKTYKSNTSYKPVKKSTYKKPVKKTYTSKKTTKKKR